MCPTRSARGRPRGPHLRSDTTPPRRPTRNLSGIDWRSCANLSGFGSKCSSSTQRRRMCVEREIDQRIIIEIDRATVIEIAVQPAGPIVEESGVDATVIIEVYRAAEIGVAEIRVLH